MVLIYLLRRGIIFMVQIILLSVVVKPASELTDGLLQSTICRHEFISGERMGLAIKEVINVGGTDILSGLYHW